MFDIEIEWTEEEAPTTGRCDYVYDLDTDKWVAVPAAPEDAIPPTVRSA
jgi:hypothetical protein